MSKFSRFFGRSPEMLTLEDVRTCQVDLASKGVAWASLNQTVPALRFFYGVTLGMAEISERIAYAREPRRLPVVLSAGEVVRFLEVGDLPVPSLEMRDERTPAREATPGDRVALHIADAALVLAFGARPTGSAGPGLESPNTGQRRAAGH